MSVLRWYSHQTRQVRHTVNWPTLHHTHGCFVLLINVVSYLNHSPCTDLKNASVVSVCLRGLHSQFRGWDIGCSVVRLAVDLVMHGTRASRLIRSRSVDWLPNIHIGVLSYPDRRISVTPDKVDDLWMYSRSVVQSSN